MAREGIMADSSWQRPGEVLVHENHEENSNFELFLPDNVPTYYADGISGAGMVGAFGRLEFFGIEAVKPDPVAGTLEKRVVRLRVTMAAPQLLENLLNLVETMLPLADQLQNATAAQTGFMAAQLARLKAFKGQ
jgi:hypothetical protein